jgi:hypothetical protein
MRNATHGYRVFENRSGYRIDCFPRSVSRYEVAKCRIFDLCRDIRLKHLETREFEIWDGNNPISKVTVKKDGSYVDRDYLLTPVSISVKLTNGEEFKLSAYRQAEGYDRDYRIATRPRLKRQKVGRSAGDITRWIGKEAGEKELARMIDKSTYVPSKKVLTRTFGR